jgi:hypothetical protein
VVADQVQGITLAMGVVLRPRTHLEGQAGTACGPQLQALSLLSSFTALALLASLCSSTFASAPDARSYESDCSSGGRSGVSVGTQPREGEGKGRASEKSKGPSHAATEPDFGRLGECKEATCTEIDS